MAKRRWTVRPADSNWGDFGIDDQLGRLNLLTAERIKQASEEIIEGRTFCLSLPLDYPGGRVLSAYRAGPVLSAVNPDGKPRFNYPDEPSEKFTDIECDDIATLTLQYSTQWDSLAHMGQFFDASGDGVREPMYYNGYRANVDVIEPSGKEGTDSGALKLGIETMAEACVQGRGVLIDLAEHLASRAGPQLVDFNTLQTIMHQDGVVVEEGDMVCLHTGMADRILSMNKQPIENELNANNIALDGRDSKLLEWITDSGLSALIADNFAVEAYPAAPPQSYPCAELPLHEHCLFKLGIPLGELWNLGPLSRWLRSASRSRFFLTAPPLRLPGAVGSPVTPVATV